MKNPILPFLAACIVLLSSVGHAAEPTSGWRGNGTGLWSDAHPPLEWYRIPHGAMEDLRSSAEPPAGPEHGNAPLVAKGLVRGWLVAGPFDVEDSIKDFDRDFLSGEATVIPAAGAAAGNTTWKLAEVPADDIMVFGTAELPWL